MTAFTPPRLRSKTYVMAPNYWALTLLALLLIPQGLCAQIPCDVILGVDGEVIKGVLESFAVPDFNICQLNGWLIIADSKRLAASQSEILQRNLADDVIVREMFAQFVYVYGKKYDSVDKELIALKSFILNLHEVVKTNLDPEATHWASCNPYCDLDFDAFTRTVLLNNTDTKPADNETIFGTPPREDPFAMGGGDPTGGGGTGGRRSLLQWPPASVDWVGAGKVTPVKNQGNCGSCWAFAATAAIESSYLMLNPPPPCRSLDLSEQQMVNCVNFWHGFFGTQGCNGGWSDDAINYVKRWWQVHETQLPYTASQSGCGPFGDPPAIPGNFVKLALNAFKATSLTEAGLKSWVASRPTVIYFCVNWAFQIYAGGIYNSATCGTCTNHAMLAVGYNRAGFPNAWRLKNSWGLGWGIAGHGYVQMNAGAYGGRGPCGIHQNAIQATIWFTNTLVGRCPPPPPPKPPRPPPPRPPPKPPSPPPPRPPNPPRPNRPPLPPPPPPPPRPPPKPPSPPPPRPPNPPRPNRPPLPPSPPSPRPPRPPPPPPKPPPPSPPPRPPRPPFPPPRPPAPPRPTFTTIITAITSLDPLVPIVGRRSALAGEELKGVHKPLDKLDLGKVDLGLGSRRLRNVAAADAEAIDGGSSAQDKDHMPHET